MFRSCFWKWGILTIVIILGVLLFFIDPEQSLFVPKCSFYWLTGWECPACGSQRAIHQLLHLNIKEAFGYNPFLVISLPYVVLVVWVHWFDANNRMTRVKNICCHPVVVATYGILIILWWIVRNLIRLC